MTVVQEAEPIVRWLERQPFVTLEREGQSGNPEVRVSQGRNCPTQVFVGQNLRSAINEARKVIK